MYHFIPYTLDELVYLKLTLIRNAINNIKETIDAKSGRNQSNITKGYGKPSRGGWGYWRIVATCDNQSLEFEENISCL